MKFWNSNVVITDFKGKVVLNFDLEKNAHSVLFWSLTHVSDSASDNYSQRLINFKYIECFSSQEEI